MRFFCCMGCLNNIKFMCLIENMKSMPIIEKKVEEEQCRYLLNSINFLANDSG